MDGRCADDGWWHEQLEGGAYTLDAQYLPGNNIVNTALRILNRKIDTVIKKIEEENK